eukprot:gene8210-9090_t
MDRNELSVFFESLKSYVEQLYEGLDINSINLIEYSCRKIQNSIDVLGNIASFNILENLEDLVDSLNRDLDMAYSRLERIKHDYDGQPPRPNLQSYATAGRPKFCISKELLENFHETGMTWTRIGRLLHVSRSTIIRRVNEYGIESTFSNISDAELDNFIREILSLTANAGETYVRGGLKSRGINVQRWRLRERLRVNLSLQEFVEQWNNHGLRTMGNISPNNLFQQSMLMQTMGEELECEEAASHSNYGIDYDGTYEDIQTDNNVVIPDNMVALSEEFLQFLSATVDPLGDDGNHGIGNYLHVLHLIEDNFF